MIDVTQCKARIVEWSTRRTAGGNIVIVGVQLNGRWIRTSPVVETLGRYVKTRSGSVYALGTASPELRRVLDELGRDFDSSCPIKVDL